MLTCTFEQGNKASLRHVTVDVLVINNNEILLVKRAPHVVSGGKYSLPGGFVERDETTQEAIIRELKEETGYETKNATLFRIIDNPNRSGEDRQNVDFVFLVDVGNKTTNPDREVENVQWFNLDALPDKEEIAFDHYGNIELYLSHKTNPKTLPIISHK